MALPDLEQPVALVRVADLDALRSELAALRTAVETLVASRAVANENASGPVLEPVAIYMSPEKFSKHVEVSLRTVRSLLKSGLPSVKVSRYVRIPVAAAETWLATDRTGT